MRYDVLVLGSGAGGLTAALSLARAGRKVMVLEAAADIGGMLNPFKRGRYEFDVGLHYVGQCGPNQAMRKLLDELGLARVAFQEINPDCIDRYVFDGYEVKLVKGIERWRDALAEQWPAERDALHRFFRLMLAVDAAMRIAVRGPRATDLWPILSNVPGLVAVLRQPFGVVLARYFSDPLLRNAFAGPGDDLGVPPGRASSLSSILLLLHYLKGAYFPIGGSGALRDALVEGIETAGGELRTKAPVTRIRPGFVVEAGDTVFEADVVVSNMDVGQTVAMLDGITPDARTRRVLRPSLGTLCVFLGLDTDLVGSEVTDANIWHYGTNDIDAAYAPLFEGIIPEKVGSCFISSPSRKDPAAHVPKGHSTLELVAFVPSEPFRPWWGEKALKRGAAYQALKGELAEKLVAVAEGYVPDLRGHVKVMETASPATVWHYVRGPDGGIYGPEQSPDQTAWRRRFPTTGVKGLYLCGAGVLGGGVYPCMLSGSLAARMVARR